MNIASPFICPMKIQREIRHIIANPLPNWQTLTQEITIDFGKKSAKSITLGAEKDSRTRNCAN